MAQWYETLFANYGNSYDKESFTQGTVGEVDFVERELAADRGKRILDIGCGTGRHAIELARRGYRVTGFDLSEGQLRLAREKAAAAGVTVDFQRRDATEPHFRQEFDAAIMFCEGAFPLMETDKLTFDLMTFREHAELTFADDAGQSQTVKTNERYYTPAEMHWLLQTAGFAKVGVFGGHLDQFSRDHALTPDDFEMLVVAEKNK
jgi:SAM-dependent methyltransferase